MSRHIDYYLAPNSPWACLGHDRFVAMANRLGCTVRVLPIDLGQVFPVSGGLPLPKRAPQRQAYRLLELRRFAEHLNVPFNIQPQFFPVDGLPASRLIVATDLALGADAALELTGRLMQAVWSQQRNIADVATLAQVLTEAGLPTHLLADSETDSVQARFAANTQAAIDAGVFGVPSFVVDGELFWGQDRLDFVERKITG
jgi:2-hydroxychromene-2-carboxylate isomerase